MLLQVLISLETCSVFSTKFQEFSRSLGKLSVIPGIFQRPGKKFQNSRSFLGIPGVVSTMYFCVFIKVKLLDSFSPAHNNY